MLESFRRLWIGWNALARRILGAQTWLLMAVTFVVGLGPPALVLRLLRRSMLDRAPADRAASSYRVVRDPTPMDMKRAARQF